MPHRDLGRRFCKTRISYAPDLADFICFSLDNFETLPEVMNVGSGIELSVKEMHQHMAKIIGYTGELKHDMDKPVGRLRRYLDLHHQQRLGWRQKRHLKKH